MSVIYQFGSESAALTNSCFYCGEELHYPWVEWRGDPSTIALHPACVLAFTVRLLADLEELQGRRMPTAANIEGHRAFYVGIAGEVKKSESKKNLPSPSTKGLTGAEVK